MTWGVIRFGGSMIYYEIDGDRVTAREVGGELAEQSAELFAAIAADVERQRGKG